MRDAVTAYSAEIGADPMLTQGAGGNVSWKSSGTMFVKASGTLLADAVRKDIFVAMGLDAVRDLIAEGRDDFRPARRDASTLRPSIETSLHALMSQTVVVHVHSVDIIARAVLADAESTFTRLLDGLDWLWVPYAKPGVDLTREIASRIAGRAVAPKILVLGNHGLVIAGESVMEIRILMAEVLSRCGTVPRYPSVSPGGLMEYSKFGYKLPLSSLAHALALDSRWLEIARTHWVMYPDHAVFLGGRAAVATDESETAFVIVAACRPPCIIIPGRGVVVRDDLTPGGEAMLTVYPEVIARIPAEVDVRSLNDSQVAALLNWDAEKYRQSLDKSSKSSG